MAKIIDVSKVPSKVTIENISKEDSKKVQAFGVNFWTEIEAEGKLILTANSSVELLYYKSLESVDGLKITIGDESSNNSKDSAEEPGV